jgi:hypothetical protein
MATCMIRIELHQARTAEQYQRLHTLLAQYGITNTILGTDGVWYRLPPAEYHYAGAANRDEVLRTSKQCATAVDPSNAVVVTESNGVTWQGLKAA